MQNRVDRAAQFLPFDALKGLQEELRIREYRHSAESKREISDEKKERIGQTLMKIAKNTKVEVTYYYDRHYFAIEGLVTKFSPTYKFLMVNDIKIFFSDIYEITIIPL